MDKAEDEPLDWHDFREGDETDLLIGICGPCNQGKHDDCPSHDEYEGNLIFYICPCHKVSA